MSKSASPTYPYINADLLGDINQDGFFNLGDIGAFKALIGSLPSASRTTSVPEPSTLIMMIACLPLFLIATRRSRAA